jgi:hypothetical protein
MGAAVPGAEGICSAAEVGDGSALLGRSLPDSLRVSASMCTSEPSRVSATYVSSENMAASLNSYCILFVQHVLVDVIHARALCHIEEDLLHNGPLSGRFGQQACCKQR